MGKNNSLIFSPSSIQHAPPLLDPCCAVGDLEGGGSRGEGLPWEERAASQGEKGRGGQVGGKKGGRPKKGQKGERATTRVSLREKRNDATDDSDLASNGPQPFSHIHAPKINLWQHFFGILHSTPLKKNLSSNSTTQNKTSMVPHIAASFKTWVHYWS
jgi:hypothetical protein